MKRILICLDTICKYGDKILGIAAIISMAVFIVAGAIAARDLVKKVDNLETRIQVLESK